MSYSVTWKYCLAVHDFTDKNKQSKKSNKTTSIKQNGETKATVT